MEFQGFAPEAIDFLWGIRMNNNRDWFTSHKQQYVEHVYAPMKALGQALYPLFQERPGTVLKVSRIYRDARLHHPDPYKESLWICVRPDGEWWAELPCLFFELRPEGVSYGFLLWHPSPAYMERFRRKIAAQPEDFLALLAQVRADTGMEVTAACYKRPKSPEDARLAPYFAWKNAIECVCTEPVCEELFGSALGERVERLFAKLLPLYDYFCLI